VRRAHDSTKKKKKVTPTFHCGDSLFKVRIGHLPPTTEAEVAKIVT